MTETLKLFLKFSITLLSIVSALYAIHEYINYEVGIDFGSFLIAEAYLSNYVMVIATYLALLVVKEKNNQAVGFMFLGGFFIKLIVFMIFFNPIYKEDLEIETAEFLAFFTPYSVCLIIETSSLVRLLNRS